MSDLSIDIESNDENIPDVIDKPQHIFVETTNKDDRHRGKPITVIEISPNGNYIVTYSEEDKSVTGWNVDNIKDKEQLKPDNVYDIEKGHKVYQICVSDDKKLAYIDYYNKLKIIDMNHDNQEIKLYFDQGINSFYCTFNLKGEFILYSHDHFKKNKIIWIYSTKTKHKWNCKKIYELPNKGFDLISISKYDKIYLFSRRDYCFYECDILTEKSIKLFGNDDEIKKYTKYSERKYNYYDYEFHDIRISSNEKFVCLKIDDKVIIYTIKIELEIPIISLNNNDIQQLYNFMNDLDPDDSDLYSLLLTSFDNKQIPSIGICNHIVEYCLKGYLGCLKQSSKECQTESLQIPPFLFDNTTKFVFGILDGYVWKIKLEESISKMNLNSFKNSDELNDEKSIESWNTYLDNEVSPVPDNKYDHLNTILLFNPYMNTIHELFQETISAGTAGKDIYHGQLELTQDLIKLQVTIDVVNNKKIQLLVQVFKKNNVNSDLDLICEKNDNYNFGKNSYYGYVYGIRLCNDNDIVILTNIGLFVYHFNESSKSISLNYFYYMQLKHRKGIKNHKKLFLKSTLPLPNYNSFKLNGWVLSVKDNKLRLLKYGVELLLFAIKEHNLELVEDIYKKCINYFKQDLENNRMLLSIITSTMPALNEYYPEYILRYSLETTMIVDSPFYSIEHQNNDLHLYSFSQYPQMVNLSRSILWTKYAYLSSLFNSESYDFSISRIFKLLLFLIRFLIILSTLPIGFIYYTTFSILSKSHFINNIYDRDPISMIFFEIFDKISSKFSKRTATPTITFMIPYIKFVNYPKDYNWFLELIRPQSNPFVETISRDIYKTWSGEALINFKWNTYGKYYYAIIWIIFMAFFGCFTTVATITLVEDVRNKLLISSISLGLIHLFTEVRQIIYNPKRWIRDFWNIFDIIGYLFPICTSIYWLKTDKMIAWLLSFSCLFLYIKLVMFFKVFESFGVYFAIIISVGKQIISFLVVLLIIIIGFAHAFYILLLPRSDNGPNSPLSLAATYNRVLDNGTIDSNPFMMKSPDDNTNMFVDYRTSILAMYLFLTGDSSSLTNWSYIKNPPLVILIVLFSLLVVVYLMNLFIGLLNMAIDKDNNRVSYLIQKAEILAEIELFYLLPNQRRWQAWFPDTIYYYANVDKTREKINEMINKEEWKADNFLLMKRDLLNKLNIQHNPDN